MPGNFEAPRSIESMYVERLPYLSFRLRSFIEGSSQSISVVLL